MDTGDLIDAVNEHRVVELMYRGGGGAVRSRIVHPHAVFRTAAGKLCLDCVQVSGDTSSGALPGWRQLELMRVADVRVLDATFSPDLGFDAAAAKYRHGLLASA
jgi:hypothetical protein